MEAEKVGTKITVAMRRISLEVLSPYLGFEG